jgi:hypothetical protein
MIKMNKIQTKVLKKNTILFDQISKKEKESLFSFCEGYKTFLSSAKTERKEPGKSLRSLNLRDLLILKNYWIKRPRPKDLINCTKCSMTNVLQWLCGKRTKQSLEKI